MATINTMIHMLTDKDVVTSLNDNGVSAQFAVPNVSVVQALNTSLTNLISSVSSDLSTFSSVALVENDFNRTLDSRRIDFRYDNQAHILYLGIKNQPDTEKLSIDCDSFIVDGMLSSVTNGTDEGGPYIEFVWNTDAGGKTSKLYVKQILGGIYKGVSPIVVDNNLSISLDLADLRNKLGYNELYSYYQFLAGLGEWADKGAIKTLSDDVSVLKRFGAKDLKFLGYIRDPQNLSSKTLVEYFNTLTMELTSIYNGSFLPVVFDDNTLKISTTDVEHPLVVGNGDVVIIHSSRDEMVINVQDLQVDSNVFVLKAGVSRYEFENAISDINHNLSCTVTVCNTLSDFDALSSYSGNNGDIAILSVPFLNDPEKGYNITGYTWRKDISAWAAMNGNYNANNIYFNYDITKAGAWSGVGNISHTPNTVQKLSSTNKSLAEVMDMIFKGDELFPSKPTPTSQGTIVSKTAEVGSSVNAQITISLDPKKYAYGSNTLTGANTRTGVTPSSYIVSYTDKGVISTITSTWTSTVADQYSKTITDSHTISVAPGVNVNSGSVSVYYSAAAENTYIPKTNLDTILSSDSQLTTYRVTDGYASSVFSTNSIVGYYPNFYGFTYDTADLPTIDSSFLRGLTNQTTPSPNGYGYIAPISAVEATSPWYNCIFAVPKEFGKSTPTAKDSNNINCTVHKLDGEIMVQLSGTASCVYDVFYIHNADRYDTLTVYFSWT